MILIKNRKIVNSLLLVFLTLILANVALGDLYINSQTGEIIFNTTSTERARITSGGLVGIGTVSPNVQLTVIGGINASGGLNVTAGDVLLATESGNVGVGTIFPNTKLEVNGTATIGGDVDVPSNDVNVGGGYDAGGVTLVGQGNDKGSGQFGKDILLDGDIISIIDVEINQSFVPTKDLFSLLGNVTQRFLDLFVANIKAGNRSLNIIANTTIEGNLTVLGNVSVDGNTFFVDTESNRVGIGTTTPAEKLVVIGKVNISDSLNVSGTVQAGLFVGDGSGLTNIVGDGSGPWNSSGSIVSFNDTSENATLNISGKIVVEELDIVSNITYKIVDGCYIDDTITVDDNSTICNGNDGDIINSYYDYEDDLWKAKCCLPRNVCWRDSDVNVNLTNGTTICNKPMNITATSIFFNDDSKWQAKCCHHETGSCFDDFFITVNDSSTMCDVQSNVDIVSMFYDNGTGSWEVECCDRMVR